MKHLFIMQKTKKHHNFEKSIEDVMKNNEYYIVYTQTIDEIKQCIEKLEEPTRIYSVGGDGTLNSVIQYLVHTNHELVVIPLGTGNDFCRVLTNEKDPLKILKNSLIHQTKTIDVIQLNDYYYINSACFGLDSIIANHVHDTPHIPFIPESKSYIVSIFQHVLQYSFEHVRMVSEGKCIYDEKMILCTVNNGCYYGGGFPITPQALLDDGYIDVCVVDHLPKWKIPYMIFFLLKKQLHKRKEVHYFKLKQLDVYCSTHCCNMDGEETFFDSCHFQVIPAAIKIVELNP